MDNEYIERGEFDARLETLEREDKRQNERLKVLDEDVKQIQKLTETIKELAVNMQHMLEEQKKQGDRLEKLENKDGEMWRTAVTYALTAVLGIVIGFALKQIGIV